MFDSDSALYWRRRGVAIAGVVTVVLLVLWAFSGPSQPPADQVGKGLNTATSAPLTFEQPAAAGEAAVQPSTQPPPGALPQAGELPAGTLQVGPPAAGAPSSGLPPQSSAAPSALPSLTPLPPLSVPNSAAPRPSVPASAPVPSAAAPSVAGQPDAAAVTGRPAGRPAAPQAVAACSDRTISVLAQVGASSYRVGEKPRFQLMVTNISDTPCTRDLDAGLQEIVVTDSERIRVWSSNDCFPAKRSDVRTLQPGKPLIFPLEWAGRTSSPGCVGQRSTVGPGSYFVTGKLGALSSGPVPFTLTR